MTISDSTAHQHEHHGCIIAHLHAAECIDERRVGVERVDGIVGDGRRDEGQREAHHEVRQGDGHVLGPPQVRELPVWVFLVVLVLHKLG